MEDIRLSLGNNPQPNDKMKQKRSSPAGLRERKKKKPEPASKTTQAESSGRNLHRQHAINQLTSDLDGGAQEKTEDAPTTQTRTAGKEENFVLVTGLVEEPLEDPREERQQLIIITL